MNKWYEIGENQRDIVFSSRVRLARNIAGYPFPNKMTVEQKCEIVRRITDAINADDSPYKDKFAFYDMDKLPRNEALALVERHIISPAFAAAGTGSALLVSEDEGVCIMINEEDHLRIQVLSAGLDFEKIYADADALDRYLEQRIPFAFNEKLGYLTECPTNIGTGMRASAMLHVPALEAVGALGNIGGTITKIGLTMRGTFGEGSKIFGALYQISNQITLGISERSAIDNLSGIIAQICERERTARDELERDRVEDGVFRAYGLLKYARELECGEFLSNISYVRMGVSMGIITETTIEKIDALILECQPNNIINTAGGMVDKDNENRLRATCVRERL